MFWIVTGAPGSSKTLNMISMFKSVKDRPIYYHGIELTEEGKRTLNWVELNKDQAYEWHEHVPHGGIFILDEAQKIFPVKSPSSPVPPGLTELETHRKSGRDVWFLSQHPMLLHSHARKICNQHYHYSRPFNTGKPYRYHSGSGFVDPNDSKALRFECVKTKVPLDTSSYHLYVSAEIHTHDKKMPGKMKLLYTLPIMAILFAYVGYKALSSSNEGENDVQPPPRNADNPAPDRGNSFMPVFGSSSRENLSWTDSLRPEINGLPYTAPLYREAASKASAIPRIAACLASADRCQCFTQQATPIPGINDKVCRHHVKNGHFDHMYPENREEQGTQSDPGEITAASESQPQQHASTSLARIQRAIEITRQTRLTASSR